MFISRQLSSLTYVCKFQNVCKLKHKFNHKCTFYTWKKITKKNKFNRKVMLYIKGQMRHITVVWHDNVRFNVCSQTDENDIKTKRWNDTNYYVRWKNCTVYFYIRTLSITTILAHICFNTGKSITAVFHILYIIRDREPA